MTKMLFQLAGGAVVNSFCFCSLSLLPCAVLLQVVWTTLTVGSSLTVALAVPDQAEKIYAVVGATAVCVVCYVIPVYIQLQMFRRSKQQRKLQVSALAGHLLTWQCWCKGVV
jgi:ABC-type arginine/histidine transport system permease subunit